MNLALASIIEYKDYHIYRPTSSVLFRISSSINSERLRILLLLTFSLLEDLGLVGSVGVAGGKNNSQYHYAKAHPLSSPALATSSVFSPPQYIFTLSRIPDLLPQPSLLRTGLTSTEGRC